MEKKMFGTVKIKPQEKMLYAIFYGCLGGLAGSLVVMFLGVSVSDVGLYYVWPLALLLMLVHPHLMCFSYAGGILSLFSLVFGFPKIDVAGLMALVAVLHLVESVLIYSAGYINAAPVFIKNEEYGIIGGFSLQEFWPVPIMLLIVVSSQIPGETLIQMPDWWPLIKPFQDVAKNPNVIFMMIPVVAALGYGDIALTATPRDRCRVSALNLLAFSCILLALSVLASRLLIFAFLSAAFAPIAHEVLIIYGKKTEKSRPPLFTPSPLGGRVLDVIRGSSAEKMGLEPGDIILSINGRDIKDPMDLKEVLSQCPTYVWLTVKKGRGKVVNCELRAYPDGINSLGAILVPQDGEVTYVVMEEEGLLSRLKRFFHRKPAERR